MSFSEPEIGLVIRYSYLWHREFSKGQEEGVKNRPCAIVFALLDEPTDKSRVLVLPVTHTQPLDENEAVKIPPQVKRHLGLDKESSWIILTEWNEFLWPGPDLRPLDNKPNSSIAYGFLPPKFYDHVRARFLEVIKTKKAKAILRTE